MNKIQIKKTRYPNISDILVKRDGKFIRLGMLRATHRILEQYEYSVILKKRSGGMETHKFSTEEKALKFLKSMDLTPYV